MPTVNYDDIPTETDVRAVLEARTKEMYQFRNGFRVDADAANRSSDSVQYPSGETFDGAMTEIAQGSEYPRAQLKYDGAEAAFTRYGFEVALHDDDIADSKINLVLDTMQQEAREQERFLDNLAFSVMDANRNATVIGTDATDLNYKAIVNAYTTLVDAGYSPSDFVLFVSPDAWGDLATSTEFTHSTETVDRELRSQGPALGEIMGIPVMMTNTGDLVDDEAFLVDTGRYGWEAMRDPFEVVRYRDESKDEWVFKVSGRVDYVPTDANACIKIQGGA